MPFGKGWGVRRSKHAAMLLAMAIVMGWSVGGTDARASRTNVVPPSAVSASAVWVAAEAIRTPEAIRTQGPQDQAEWRFVAVRR